MGTVGKTPGVVQFRDFDLKWQTKAKPVFA
jgi:hypothetical protein